MSDCSCHAILTARALSQPGFKEAFPRGEIPLKFPHEVRLQHAPGQRFWIADSSRMQPDQVEAFAAAAARKWGASLDEVLADYKREGIAIRTTHTRGMAYCPSHTRILIA